jgi:hypothetical protein
VPSTSEEIRLLSKRLSEAPGYDKFVMSFADKIAKQLDAEKLEKEGEEIVYCGHDLKISENDRKVSCELCNTEWTR